MPPPEAAPAGAAAVVLDTNIVLDLWVFADAAAQPLRLALEKGRISWLATGPMREELARVLAYPHIARRLAQAGRSADEVLQRFDDQAQLRQVPPKAAYHCKDADDQKFVDLAAAHQTLLLSKDQAVLCMARRLQKLGVETRSQFEGRGCDEGRG